MPQLSHPKILNPVLSFLLVIGFSAALTACGQTRSQAPVTPPRSSSANQVPTPTEPALAPPLPGSYAALGASETYGVGAQPHTRGYAYRVASGLGARSFVDEGIPGTTLNAAYERELTNALTIRPYLCTVFFGYNDLAAGVTRASFLLDLHDFVTTLRRAGSQVLIIGMPPLSNVPAAQRIPNLAQTVDTWNAGIKRVAGQTGARFLDLRAFASELRTKPYYIASDGLHPSNAGHQRLAGVILSTVRTDHLWK